MQYASKVAMCRVQIPKLAYDNHTLEFWNTGNASASFDPGITTSQATAIVWQPDDAVPTVTTGTSHAYSYVPAEGLHRCKVTLPGGMSSISAIDSQDDSLTRIKNLIKCANCRNITLAINANLEIDLKDFPLSYSTDFNIRSCPKLTGSLSDVWSGAIIVTLYGDTLLTGSLADLKCTGVRTVRLESCTGVTAGSISQLQAIRDIRVTSMGWLTANVDLVLMSISEAILADPAHFSYTTPALQIGGGSNQAPSGTYQAPSGEDGHAVSGMEAIYAMVNNAGHAWTVSYNGGSKP